MNQQAVADVKRSIENLIEHGSAYKIEELERLYHPTLRVYIINEDGRVDVSDKPQNIAFFRSKLESGAEPLSRWAEFNLIEAQEATAHVIVTRKMQLRDKPEKLVLSIDLILDDDRWQIVREVVFAQHLAWRHNI